MQRSIITLFASAFVLSTAAVAQTCPPGTLCGPGTTCTDILCAPGSFVMTQTVSVSSGALQPPQTNQVLSVPRFTPAANQHLIRAQIDIAANIVNGSIEVRNLTNSPIFNQHFTLQSTVGIYGSFMPLLPPGTALLPSSDTFVDNFGPTTWPGPPANPCVFTGPDAVIHQNLTGFDGKRLCIDDPTLLATQFTSSGSASTVDLTYNSADSSTHQGGGMICILYLNFTSVSVTVTYTYCLSVPTPGQLTCPGNGTQPAPCPCGNSGLAARGCASSAVPQGAGLYVVGDPSVDDVMFLGSDLPLSALCVLLQGDAALAPGLAFGDGLRCVGGHLYRLYARTAQSGTFSAPLPSDTPVRARAAQLGDVIAPGAARQYQVFYRDPNPGFCPAPQGNTFNASNGCALVWP